MTPRAAYLAPVRSAAASTIRWSTASIDSSEVTAIAAWTTALSRSWSVCGIAQNVLTPHLLAGSAQLLCDLAVGRRGRRKLLERLLEEDRGFVALTLAAVDEPQ